MSSTVPRPVAGRPRTGRRLHGSVALTVLIAAALFVDASLGAVWPGTPPVATLAAVSAAAAVRGARRGMLIGFCTGVVLDLLAGPASVAGTHALTGIGLGLAVGSAGRPGRTVVARPHVVGFAPADRGRTAAAWAAAVVAVPLASVAPIGVRMASGVGTAAEPIAAAAAGFLASAVIVPAGVRLATHRAGRPLSSSWPRS